MILTRTVAASASHVETCNDDLLSLGTYEDVEIVTAAPFLTLPWRTMTVTSTLQVTHGIEFSARLTAGPCLGGDCSTSSP
jgi:hypothetical protein